MKLSICVLFALLLFSFVKTDKEIPAKIYYKNATYVHLWGFGSDDPYPDTAMYLNTFEEFNFKGQVKTITVYFDPQFTLPAVSMTLDKKDKTMHYRRFDRKGVLRMEYIQKNSETQGLHAAWYSNGLVKNKWWYKNGTHVTDTAYYFTGELKQATLYYNSKAFKEQHFYKNGRLESEWFWRVPELKDPDQHDMHSPKFKIEYDSINGFPNLYYLQDSDYFEMMDDGTEVGIRTFKQFKVDSVLFYKK